MTALQNSDCSKSMVLTLRCGPNLLPVYLCPDTPAKCPKKDLDHVPNIAQIMVDDKVLYDISLPIQIKQ
jgi:hypothetical protein